ncbi:MAG: hypothetical protein KAJ51_11835 [Thermoplasmata archaeon]|nr:hypothetical protein [Thermoplasmata archaeon]
MLSIAEWRRALYYFWIFGIISVLIDLDHAIKVYEDGLEINFENMWHNGTRALHIPILVLSGCLFIFVFALFIRFWHLNYSAKNTPGVPEPVVDSTDVIDPEIMYVKCPKCKSLMGVIATTDIIEFPCVNCGIIGSISVHTAQPAVA